MLPCCCVDATLHTTARRQHASLLLSHAFTPPDPCKPHLVASRAQKQQWRITSSAPRHVDHRRTCTSIHEFAARAIWYLPISVQLLAGRLHNFGATSMASLQLSMRHLGAHLAPHDHLDQRLVKASSCMFTHTHSLAATTAPPTLPSPRQQRPHVAASPSVRTPIYLHYKLCRDNDTLAHLLYSVHKLCCTMAAHRRHPPLAVS